MVRSFPYRLAGIALLCVLALASTAPLSDLAAQTVGKSPFGIGDAAPGGGAPSGWVAWLLTKQAEYTRAMIAALRSTKDGAGLWTLCSIAFAYGVFHAAGPGHGKAIVSSYVFANEQALRRGVGIALAAALLQALVAITLVVPAVTLLGATARQIDRSVAWIEIISFSGIVALGLSLIWRKARAVRLAWSSTHDHHGHGPGCGHDHHDHVHGPHCSHTHLPEAHEVTGDRSWRDLAAATFAAGSRPCSGAIVLLAFALSAGAVGAGILAVFAMAAGTALTTAGFAAGSVFAKGLVTRLADGGERLGRVTALIELGAAIAITLFGVALLAGYIAAG